MKLEAAEDKDAMAARITAVLEQKRPMASRLVRVHQYYWLRMWLESAAIGKGGKFASVDGGREGLCLYHRSQE